MKVTIYTLPSCKWCHKMIDYIMSSNLVDEFQVQELCDENHDSISTYLRQATDRQEVGFPVTIVTDEIKDIRHIIIGFDTASFEKTIKG